jgi:hypothetical protein
MDPVNLAVEISRHLPASGNLGVCGQQFWLGPRLGGVTIRMWIDATVVHILRDDVRLKPCRPGSPRRTRATSSPTADDLPDRHHSLRRPPAHSRSTGWSTPVEPSAWPAGSTRSATTWLANA